MLYRHADTDERRCTKGKNMTGNEAVLIDFPGQKKKAWKRDKLNKNKKGSVYERGGKLYVYFF